MSLSVIRKWVVRKFAEALLGDIAKGEYGMDLKKIWDWLNGRKQAIGLVLVLVTSLAEQVPAIVEAFGGDQVAVAKVLSYVVLAVGSLHKVLKGS